MNLEEALANLKPEPMTADEIARWHEFIDKLTAPGA